MLGLSNARIAIYTSLSTFLLLALATAPVKAAGTNTIEVSPSNFIVLENDLGKKLDITVKNITDKDQKFTITECLAKRENGKISPTTDPVIKSAIEISPSTLTIKASETGTISTRVRISASGGTNIPCVLITPQTQANQEVSIDAAFAVPYLIQNFKGTHQFDLNVDIGITGIVTATDLSITGSIENTGEKFFTPQGTVVISKNGTKLAEQEITSQINSLMMPGDKLNYSVKWGNKLLGVDSVGEYTIEVKVSTDQSSKTVVKQLTYTYIPQDFILGGGIAVGAIVLIIVGVLVLKKKKS